MICLYGKFSYVIWFNMEYFWKWYSMCHKNIKNTYYIIKMCLRLYIGSLTFLHHNTALVTRTWFEHANSWSLSLSQSLDTILMNYGHSFTWNKNAIFSIKEQHRLLIHYIVNDEQWSKTLFRLPKRCHARRRKKK